MNAASAVTCSGWLAQTKVPYGREHRSRLVSPDPILPRVEQGFPQEVFVHEHAASIGERDGMTREAGKAWADVLPCLGEVTRRAPVGDNQASALLDELLLGREGFGGVLGLGRREPGLGAWGIGRAAA